MGVGVDRISPAPRETTAVGVLWAHVPAVKLCVWVTVGAVGKSGR